MKKNLLVILLILFVPVVAYFALSKTQAKESRIIEAKGQPQIIKFTSTMCLDCQKMNKIFKEIYPKYKDKITLTEIHVQDGKSFTGEQIEKYNVTLVPTIILVNSNGKIVRRIEGAIEQYEMEELMEGLD